MPNTRRSTTTAGLRAVLLEQAREVRDPIYARFAALSGNDAKLKAHDAMIAGLADGSAVKVSAQNLADALAAMQAPWRDTAATGHDFVIEPDGAIRAV